MQHQKTAPSLAGLFGVRAIVLLALAAGLLFVLGQARDARAVNDGTFNFNVSSVTVNEGDLLVLDVVAGGRGAGAVNVNVGVHVNNISGEAGDYNMANQCVFFSGAVNSQPLQIQTFVDADLADEQFTVTLTFNSTLVGCANPGADASIGGQSTVTVTINDGGSGGGGTNAFHFAATSTVAEEGDNVTLNVVRTGDLVGSASVDCEVVGGAEGADYDILVGTANFGNADPSGSCTIHLEDDGDTDVFETLIVRLVDPSTGHTVAEPDEHTITILEDDAEIVQFSAASYTVDEDEGIASFTVTRTNPAGTDVFICRTVELSGQADEDVDYGETDDTLTFTGSDGSEQCTVPIINDNTVEGPETFRLVLEKESGDAVLGPINEALVTIEDDDLGITFQFSAANYNVNESNTEVTITVTRSSGVGTGSVNWDLSNGTATAGQDYVDDSGTVFFSAGETSDTFTVDILQDAVVEGNETILMSLSTPIGGSLGTPSNATITIVDSNLPTVTNVSPSTLNLGGGQNVTITGTNLTGATAVTFCGTNAQSFVVNNSTQITAVSPARPAGVCDVRVTTPAGTSANTAADNVTYSAGTTTVTYPLTARWSLIAWLGRDNANITSALQGNVSLSGSSLDQSTPNNIYSVVTAVATWHNPTQRYLFWFPAGAGVPGANDFTQFDYGTAYWIAVTSNVNWTVVEGP